MIYDIKVYMDDGRVFTYQVEGDDKVREHAYAIIKDGYRHNTGEVFEYYGPHRVLKVKVIGNVPTKYIDNHTGT